jgi:ubiquitin carboxyl-terminal hydrolase 22/27/51
MPKRGEPEKPDGPDRDNDLLSCLADFTDVEITSAEPDGSKLGYTCQSAFCRGEQSMVRRQLLIQELPPTLCICVKRYKFQNGSIVKHTGRFRFPLELDMTPYMTSVGPSSNTPPYATAGKATSVVNCVPRHWYDLYSAVVHVGTMQSGHYTAYCKREGVWLLFDDDLVRQGTEEEVMNAGVYLLFYLRRGLSDEEENRGLQGRNETKAVDSISQAIDGFEI